ARELRTTYCSGLTDSTSLGIRADGTNNPICRGAVDNFCKGDKLFASASGAGVFNCLSDEGGTYNADRETHYDLCDGDMASRANVDCDLAQVEICTTTDGAQTNPWAPICADESIDTLATRQAVVAECAPLDAGARGAIPRCGRTVTDSTPNNSVTEILATCDRDPREGACDDYAGAEGAYVGLRRGQYVLNCADADALTGQSDADFCPEANVKPLICVTNGANARPFAPICAQGGADANLETYKRSVLDFCIDTGTPANATDARCTDTTAAMTITSAGTQCGSVAAAGNPFNPSATITGFAAGVDCTTIGAYSTVRDDFTEACRDADSGYNADTCNKGTVLATVCNASTGEFANPFSAICTTAYAGMRLAFANSCVGQSSTTALGNGAFCPVEVISCANNPFQSACSDVAYNAQKTAVIGLCDTDAEIVSDTTGRCAPALDDVRCLKDPFGTCEGTDLAQLNFVAGGDGGALFTTLKTNRQLTCRGGDLVNSQKNICRTAHTATAACLRNPFGNCTTELGAGNLSDYRTNRLAYCRNSANAAQTSISNTNTATISDTNVNLCNAPSTEIDAAGIICGSTSDSTFAFQAGLDNMRDPFIAACLQITDYNDERSTRISNCSTAASDQSTWTCNYAAQATYCDIAPSGSIPTGCPPIQTVTRWRESFGTAVAFSDAAAKAGSQNKFINNFNAAGPDAGLEVVEYNSARATRITDSTLTNAISLAFLS
ncbi:MAG: hypothetical protein K8953_05065, partial [Proteobacteria bacterium]|nr:hypothetical protein [Pseudomonadota bacterium]